jgi:hypothetical protein
VRCAAHCEPDEVSEFVAQWTEDAERHNAQIVAEIERVKDEPGAPTHTLN